MSIVFEPPITDAYRYWRNHGYPAMAAMAAAKRDAEKGTARYPESGLASYQNAPNDRGGRWIENPAAAGLRFVGWSDDIASIRHTGWHLDPHGDGETARGCVYQLPARDGRPIFVAAVAMGSRCRDGRSWVNQCGRDGAAIIYLNERHIGPVGGEQYPDADHYVAHFDAAHGADREAEILAKSEREYQEAWQAGSQAAEFIEKATTLRTAARELLREFRRMRRAAVAGEFPAACATLRQAIRGHLQSAIDAKEEARELVSQWSGLGAWRANLEDAFKEGLRA